MAQPHNCNPPWTTPSVYKSRLLGAFSVHVSVLQQGSNECTKVLFLRRMCPNAFFFVPCTMHTMVSQFGYGAPACGFFCC